MGLLFMDNFRNSFFSFMLRSLTEKDLPNDGAQNASVPDSDTIIPALTADLKNDAKPVTQSCSDERQINQNRKTNKQASVDTNGDEKQGIHGGDNAGKTALKGLDLKEIETGSDQEGTQVNGGDGNPNETHGKSNEQRAVTSKKQITLQSNPVDIKNTPLVSGDTKNVGDSGRQDLRTPDTGVTKTNGHAKVTSSINNLQNNEGRSGHNLTNTERSHVDEECINVVFHALLTPTFNFQRGYNKVVLRGHPPFSWRPGRQLEIRVGR